MHLVLLIIFINNFSDKSKHFSDIINLKHEKN